MPRALSTLFVYATGFLVAAGLATACDPSYSVTAFRCDPANPDCPTNFGTGTYVCCSDDAAALDTNDFDVDNAVPNFGSGGAGTALFGGANNHLSRSGFCIDIAKVPANAAITVAGSGQGCPLPCNPTWTNEQVTDVCGSGTDCCQSVLLQPEDCVLDMTVGDSGCWRPVTGGDIAGLGGIGATQWRTADHETHQDPGGGGCRSFAAGNSAAENACYRQLSVANQRGFCQGAGQCPLVDPAYRDPCEEMNDAEGKSGCAEVEFP